jgi:hypothetical protein
MILATLTVDEWIEILTPIAVSISIIFQKINSTKVKTALEDASVKSDVKLNTIHGLVNGNMTEQKRVTMIQAKRIALLTNDPSDQALAVNAERSYEDHLNIQQAALTKELPLEHRMLVTDGPAVKMILQRLESIEGKVKSLKCVGSECPPEVEPVESPKL